MAYTMKSLLTANAALQETLVPCDGSTFSLPYQRRFLELLEETKTLELSASCEIHPRLGFEKKECAEARGNFNAKDWILALVILRGERMVSGLLVYKKIPSVSYLFDCMSLQIKAAYYEGLEIDEGNGERTDLAFFVETLEEIAELAPKPIKKQPAAPVTQVRILGEDDEEYEAPEVEVAGFVPSKKRTFTNKKPKPEPIEIPEDEEIEVQVEKPAFSARKKGKPRRL